MLSHIETLAREIAERQGLNDTEIDIKPGSKKGDGFLSDIYMVTVRTRDGNQLSIIVKCATSNEAVLDKYHIREAFQNEEKFYNVILPNMDEFQKQKHIPYPFRAVAKYYGSNFDKGKRLLGLENLKTRGFELFDKKAAVDGKHVEAVFTEYGKFHGVSFAYQNEHKDTFDKITATLHDCWDLFLQDKQFTKLLDVIFKDISNFLEEGDENLRDKLKRYEDSASVFNEVYVCKGKYSTLTHGDCWTNNILFKYGPGQNGARQLESIRILDWQVIRIGTPVYDLSYFLYASASKPVFDNLDHYLEVYYKSLSRTLRDLGHDPETVYPFHVLKSHWKEYSTFGFLLGLLLQRMKLTYDDNIVDLHDVTGFDTGEEVASEFCNTKYDVEVFKERALNIVRHRSETGVL